MKEDVSTLEAAPAEYEAEVPVLEEALVSAAPVEDVQVDVEALNTKLQELGDAISCELALEEAVVTVNEVQSKYCKEYNISETAFDLVQEFYEEHKENDLIANGFLRKIMAESK